MLNCILKQLKQTYNHDYRFVPFRLFPAISPACYALQDYVFHHEIMTNLYIFCMVVALCHMLFTAK